MPEVVQSPPGNPGTVSPLAGDKAFNLINYDSDWNQPNDPRVMLASSDKARWQGEGTAALPHLGALSPAPHSVSSSPPRL